MIIISYHNCIIIIIVIVIIIIKFLNNLNLQYMIY